MQPHLSETALRRDFRASACAFMGLDFHIFIPLNEVLKAPLYVQINSFIVSFFTYSLQILAKPGLIQGRADSLSLILNQLVSRVIRNVLSPILAQ